MDAEERKDLHDELSEKLEAFRELIGTIDPDFLRRVRDAAAAATKWIQITNQVRAAVELERDLLPKLAEHGWLLTPSGPFDQPERLNAVYENGGIEAVDVYLMEHLDADACGVIVDHIATFAVFAPWRPTFAKALAAMERGDHELAIPIWLAALEFACKSKLGVRDVYSKHKEADRAVQTKLARLSTVYEPIALAWLEVLLGFSGKRGRGPAIFHRHAVMHGERPLIGTRKDALQCLLALEVLGYLVDARDRKGATQSQ